MFILLRVNPLIAITMASGFPLLSFVFSFFSLVVNHQHERYVSADERKDLGGLDKDVSVTFN